MTVLGEADDAPLYRRGTIGTRSYYRHINVWCGKKFTKFPSRIVFANRTDASNTGAECGGALRNIGSASTSPLAAANIKHRHRRIGTESLRVTLYQLIQHDIAHHCHGG